MPAPELSDMYQSALMWPAAEPNKHGLPTHGSPVELRVRWTDVLAEQMDAQGNTLQIDASAIVDRAVRVGSLMWLAPDSSSGVTALEQWYGHTGTSSGSATDDDQLMIVVSYDATPDVKNRYVEREVSLKRYKGVP